MGNLKSKYFPGFDPEELVNRKIAEFSHPEEAKVLLDTLSTFERPEPKMAEVEKFENKKLKEEMKQESSVEPRNLLLGSDSNEPWEFGKMDGDFQDGVIYLDHEEDYKSKNTRCLKSRRMKREVKSGDGLQEFTKVEKFELNEVQPSRFAKSKLDSTALPPTSKSSGDLPSHSVLPRFDHMVRFRTKLKSSESIDDQSDEDRVNFVVLHLHGRILSFDQDPELLITLQKSTSLSNEKSPIFKNKRNGFHEEASENEKPLLKSKIKNGLNVQSSNCNDPLQKSPYLACVLVCARQYPTGTSESAVDALVDLKVENVYLRNEVYRQYQNQGTILQIPSTSVLCEPSMDSIRNLQAAIHGATLSDEPQSSWIGPSSRQKERKEQSAFPKFQEWMMPTLPFGSDVELVGFDLQDQMNSHSMLTKVRSLSSPSPPDEGLKSVNSPDFPSLDDDAGLFQRRPKKASKTFERIQQQQSESYAEQQKLSDAATNQGNEDMMLTQNEQHSGSSYLPAQGFGSGLAGVVTPSDHVSAYLQAHGTNGNSKTPIPSRKRTKRQMDGYGMWITSRNLLFY
jgi:hypothetical protein